METDNQTAMLAHKILESFVKITLISCLYMGKMNQLTEYLIKLMELALEF